VCLYSRPQTINQKPVLGLRMRWQEEIERFVEWESEFFIDNLLVRIHSMIEMIWWTGLAPREFEFPFPGSLVSTFLVLSLFLLPAALCVAPILQFSFQLR